MRRHGEFPPTNSPPTLPGERVLLGLETGPIHDPNRTRRLRRGRSRTLLPRIATHAAQLTEENPILVRFSSLSRLLRVTALCFRFVLNARRPAARGTGFLTRDELEEARLWWLQIAQRTDFPQEITRLSRSQPLPTDSTLLPLRPFVGRDGLLRLGGRLRQALLSYDEKHPPFWQRVATSRSCTCARRMLFRCTGGRYSPAGYY